MKWLMLIKDPHPRLDFTDFTLDLNYLSQKRLIECMSVHTPKHSYKWISNRSSDRIFTGISTLALHQQYKRITLNIHHVPCAMSTNSFDVRVWFCVTLRLVLWSVDENLKHFKKKNNEKITQMGPPLKADNWTEDDRVKWWLMSAVGAGEEY